MNGWNYDSNLSYVPLYSFSQWAPIFQYLFWFLHTQLCAESKKKKKRKLLFNCHLNLYIKDTLCSDCLISVNICLFVLFENWFPDYDKLLASTWWEDLTFYLLSVLLVLAEEHQGYLNSSAYCPKVKEKQVMHQTTALTFNYRSCGNSKKIWTIFSPTFSWDCHTHLCCSRTQ